MGYLNVKIGDEELVLPAPDLAVLYAIEEDAESVLVLFSNKLSNERLPGECLRRTISEQPNHSWRKTPGYPYRTGPAGSPRTGS